MLRFLAEHIFEILLSVIIALLAYIGKHELARIDELVCHAVATNIEITYESTTNALGGLSSIDDLRDKSRPIRALQEVIDDSGGELSKCDKGRKILREMQTLVAGLHAYVNKNYTSAVTQFESMNMEKSLPHYLLGAAYGHASEFTSSPSDAIQLTRKAIDQFSRALDIAREESGGSIKEAVLLTLKCKQYLVSKTPEANNLAMSCFNELIAKKYDDHNMYYNLACLYSRQGRWNDTLSSFRRYLDAGGAIKDARSKAENDPDFANHIMKSNRSGEFATLLNRYSR